MPNMRVNLLEPIYETMCESKMLLELRSVGKGEDGRGEE
jgi:hypothetical protein